MATNLLAQPASFDAAEAEECELAIRHDTLLAEAALRPRPGKRATDEEWELWQEWHGENESAIRIAHARLTFLRRWLKTRRGPNGQRPGGNGLSKDMLLRGPDIAANTLNKGELLHRIITVLDDLVTGDEDVLTPKGQTAIAELRQWSAAQSGALRDGTQ